MPPPPPPPSPPLTSVAGVACVPGAALAVGLAQARQAARAVLAVRHLTRVKGVLVLLVTEHAGETRLAATRVRVRVDGQAGAVDTSEGGGESYHCVSQIQFYTCLLQTTLACRFNMINKHD